MPPYPDKFIFLCSNKWRKWKEGSTITTTIVCVCVGGGVDVWLLSLASSPAPHATLTGTKIEKKQNTFGNGFTTATQTLSAKNPDRGRKIVFSSFFSNYTKLLYRLNGIASSLMQ